MAGTPSDLLLRGHQLLQRQAELANRWECDLPECDGLPHEGWLHNHARTAQREPTDYETWLLLTGRGFGKTRTGSETVKKWGTGSRRMHIAVVGKTERETRNICFEGPAGLNNVIRPDLIKRGGYKRTSGDISLALTNGTVYRAMSSEKPDALRGYAFDGGWFDEYAAWPVGTAQDCWDNMWFALREARDPHLLVTTTPRNLAHVKAVLNEQPVVTRGHILDNAANLSDKALNALYRRYEGTRLGRQELSGELLEDVEGALWNWSMIEDNRWTGDLDALGMPVGVDIWRIVVGIDPAGTDKASSDETGIVVVGAGGPRERPELYILDDVSGRYSPDGWAKMSIDVHDKWGADCLAPEQNNGWDMVNATLKHQDSRIRIKKVYATRGKHLRAEPIVALYEQGRVHHVGGFGNLEDQMTSWTPADTSYSPDRLDAMVYAATELTHASTELGTAGFGAMNTPMTPRARW